MGYYPLLEPSYTPPAAYVARGEASGVGQFGLFGSEYSFIENANLIRGLVDMFSLMYPQLQDIDFRTDVPALEVPVYVLDGANELRGRRELAHEWFARLDGAAQGVDHLRRCRPRGRVRAGRRLPSTDGRARSCLPPTARVQGVNDDRRGACEFTMHPALR